MSELDGVLVIDKPPGLTSAQVVARVKRLLGVKRVGHTGTLDPMATGVLPLVIGEGTKIAAFLLADDKSYSAAVQLGAETDTHDADGRVVAEAREAAAGLRPEQVEAAAAALRGTILQVPPMYSALKKDGKRLYQLAREGIAVEREPREVIIHSLDLHRVEPPVVEFSVTCSKGTYVRSLARDLGRALGVFGHLASLRRTRAGGFGIDQAVTVEGLDAGLAQSRLVSPADALAHLPAIWPEDAHLVRISQGLPRWAHEIAPNMPEGEIFRCLTPLNRLLAIAVVDGDDVRYKRVFPAALGPVNKG